MLIFVPRMQHPRFFAFIAIVFWGISFVATKAALREVSPVTLIFCRFAIGALVLLALVLELPPREEIADSTIFFEFSSSRMSGMSGMSGD